MKKCAVFACIMLYAWPTHTMSDPERKEHAAICDEVQECPRSSSFFTKHNWSALSFPSTGHSIPCAAFHPDNSILAFSMNTPRKNHSPYFHDVSRNRFFQHPIASRNMTTTMTFSPDGTMFAFGKIIDKTNTLLTVVPSFNYQEGTWIQHESSLLPSRITSMQFSPNNATLALASNNGLVRIWDVEQNIRSTTLCKNEHTPVHALAYIHDNAVCFNDPHGGLMLRDMRGPRPIKLPFMHTDIVRAVAASITRNILVSGCGDGYVRFTDFRKLSSALMLYREYNSQIMSLALHPYYAEALVGYYNGKVRLYATTETPTGAYKSDHHTYVTAVTLSATNQYLAASTSHGGRLTLYGNKRTIRALVKREDKHKGGSGQGAVKL